MNGLKTDTIINRDALYALRELPEESVHCCVTSPPYYALRDYGLDMQIGREDTPEQYIDRLTEVFRELRRVLRSDLDSIGHNAMKTLRHFFIVGHVHDELIIECSPYVDLNAVCEQMGKSPDWMPDILLRADGYETMFYKKD